MFVHQAGNRCAVTGNYERSQPGTTTTKHARLPRAGGAHPLRNL